MNTVDLKILRQFLQVHVDFMDIYFVISVHILHMMQMVRKLNQD